MWLNDFIIIFPEKCFEGVKFGLLEKLAQLALFSSKKSVVIGTEINGWTHFRFDSAQLAALRNLCQILHGHRRPPKKLCSLKLTELLTMAKTTQPEVPFTFNMAGNPVDLSICALYFFCLSYKCDVPALFHSKQLFNNTDASTGKRINYYVENGENVNLHSEITLAGAWVIYFTAYIRTVPSELHKTVQNHCDCRCSGHTQPISNWTWKTVHTAWFSLDAITMHHLYNFYLFGACTRWPSPPSRIRNACALNGVLCAASYTYVTVRFAFHVDSQWCAEW